ncbi:uncharacterized protein LAESUDRAFT_197771 [Laetiporus sulphureus 93-53]|uniref:F-box domain-containing protein n=1 Tax=Laetiporus sulphureus 93-53 TaxID=1314785 RepID=A0A165E206_9APHY|nr:uncharacterized protein LAESUDRAFT_197771 [Laetiporus sulphureus 93-53]KZT06094.1 hypothetical protein LAESUDRAFT_197771 [Laetiporus sulphureus 93-53]
MAAPTVDASAAPPVNDPQPRLPLEICERIIDHLDPDWYAGERQTLLNCALICRGWYAESRAVLFEEPELRTWKQAVACVTSLKQIPLLAARVRQLRIGHHSDSETVVTGAELASILVMLAEKLPNLARLAFSHVSFEHCSMRVLAFWSLHEFSHITSLWLLSVTLPSASPFVQVICSFPHLQDLYCYDLRWSESRSMASLPEHHRMPLRTVTSLEYDLSCFEDIGHILLGLLDQKILKSLRLESAVSEAALAFTQDMLNMAGTRLEGATILFQAPEEDAGGNFQSLLLHPISFEANDNLQSPSLAIFTSNTNDVALFVQSLLLPVLDTISSKGLKDVHFVVASHSKLETDALLNAFDLEVCIQIDELLAEGTFCRTARCIHRFPYRHRWIG